MVEGYRQSGKSREEYCRSQGIPVTTLNYYLHRQSLKARPRLAKVTVRPSGPSLPGTSPWCCAAAVGSRPAGISATRIWPV